jgi:hypothetical protein
MSGLWLLWGILCGRGHNQVSCSCRNVSTSLGAEVDLSKCKTDLLSAARSIALGTIVAPKQSEVLYPIAHDRDEHNESHKSS